MIDQASVFADRFRNNRQALQAAVLGQNSGVDPYTALRALQLLKESDSMQMAQQGQQPTEAPSLLQEAMQPPQMPMGIAVPGQQMSQAPQQSGGLEAIPVPEQDFAGGGIIAFAGGGSGDIEMLRQKAQDAKRLYEAAAKSGDTRASDLYLRQQRDAEAALAEAMKGPEETGSAMYGKGPTIGLPDIDIPSVEDFTRFAGRNIKQEVDPAKLAEDRARSADQVAQIPDDTGARVIPTQPMDQTPTSLTPDMMMSPGGVGLRGLEAAANISDGSATRSIVPPAAAPEAPPAINQAPPPNEQQDAPTAGGLGALAAPTYTPASRDRLNAALDAQAAFTPTKSTITPPRGLQEKITALKGEKGSLAALKGLFGDDEASTKAQNLLNKRLRELEDPDRNKFEKALGFFKAAGALQKTIDKDGRRVTPMGAAAEAMGEVASVYSGIRKEDRKAKQLIEDSQMALDRAAQAREEGLVGKAFDLENQADKDKTAAETLQANINARKDQAKATMLAATTTAEGAAYSGDRSSAAQVYASDLARLSAKERNATNEKMNMLTAERLVTDKNLAAYNAASDTLRKAEVDVDKAMKGDTDLQRVIGRISSYESRAAKGELDKKELAALENSRAKRAQLEKKYADQLKGAKERFNVISNRVISASDASAGGGAPTTDYTAKPIDQATFNSLPKGTKFMDPNGQIRTK
jgi:hypothetical protein